MPPSRIKQSKKNSGNAEMCSDAGNGEDSLLPTVFLIPQVLLFLFLFFGFTLSFIFLVLLFFLFLCFTSPLSAPPFPGPHYLRAPPRKIFFLILFPPSKPTTLHQLSWLASLSLKTNHCPHHFQYKCAPNCSRPC